MKIIGLYSETSFQHKGAERHPEASGSRIEAGEPETSVAPALFWLTESCLLRQGRPFFIPDWDREFGLFPMLALKVTRVGKGMAARFAPRYLTEASLFLHARGLDSLKALRSRSVPLAAALAFDGSLISARFLPLALEGLDWVNARVQVLPADGKEAHRLDFSCRGLAGTAARLLEFTGSRNTLRTGDLLLLPLGNEPLIPARGRHMSLSLQLPSGQWEKVTEFLIK